MANLIGSEGITNLMLTKSALSTSGLATSFVPRFRTPQEPPPPVPAPPPEAPPVTLQPLPVTVLPTAPLDNPFDSLPFPSPGDRIRADDFKKLSQALKVIADMTSLSASLFGMPFGQAKGTLIGHGYQLARVMSVFGTEISDLGDASLDARKVVQVVPAELGRHELMIIVSEAVDTRLRPESRRPHESRSARACAFAGGRDFAGRGRARCSSTGWPGTERRSAGTCEVKETAVPIAQNLGAFTLGSRITSSAFLPETFVAPVAPPAAPPPAPTPPAAQALTTMADLTGFAIPPGALASPSTTAVSFPPSAPQAVPATTLARGALAQLSGSDAGTLNNALNAIGGQGVIGDALMDYLERKVRIGEVLGNRAAQWSDQTRADFAGPNGAFRMEPDKTDVMDAIVSIAILNDRHLEAEIRGENTKETTATDLLQSRRVVWQSPPAGSVLSPPYIVIVAVEYQEQATAASAVSAITDQLDMFKGFRLPKAAIQKL